MIKQNPEKARLVRIAMDFNKHLDPPLENQIDLNMKKEDLDQLVRKAAKYVNPFTDKGLSKITWEYLRKMKAEVGKDVWNPNKYGDWYQWYRRFTGEFIYTKACAFADVMLDGFPRTMRDICNEVIVKLDLMKGGGTFNYVTVEREVKKFLEVLVVFGLVFRFETDEIGTRQYQLKTWEIKND